MAIDEALDIGEVVHADTHAAAIWVTDDASAAVAEASCRARTDADEALLGGRGFDHYRRISQAMAENVPAGLQGAWYLSILGVHPIAQGRGIAGELLQSTLRRADDRGVSCFLETFNPASLAFYERAGFREATPCFETITARPYWILVRQPSAQARRPG